MVELVLILLATIISFGVGFDCGKLAGLCEAEEIVFKYFNDVTNSEDDE